MHEVSRPDSRGVGGDFGRRLEGSGGRHGAPEGRNRLAYPSRDAAPILLTTKSVAVEHALTFWCG